MSEKPYTLISSDLQALLDAAPASDERYQIKRIYQGLGATMIRIAFRAGQVMKEHSTNAPLIVQVLRGDLRFRVAGDEITMTAGSILQVDPFERHELEAVADTDVLLTLCVQPNPVGAAG